MYLVNVPYVCIYGMFYVNINSNSFQTAQGLTLLDFSAFKMSEKHLSARIKHFVNLFSLCCTAGFPTSTIKRIKANPVHVQMSSYQELVASTSSLRRSTP